MLTTKRLWIDRDQKMRDKWIELLTLNQLNPDNLIDYTVGIFDGERLVGTGSTHQNIIKLVAICGDYQDQNLLTQLMTHLSNVLWDNGETNIFLYTKPDSAKFFHSLGFQSIADTSAVTLMERGTPNFEDYEKMLQQVQTDTTNNGAIVMNANPFTKGHLYLIETALKQCDHLYVFVLSDDSSTFSFEDRFHLVKQGTAHLERVTILPSGSYQVSQATFPSYFLKNQAEEEVGKHQAALDATLFSERIAPKLNIHARFVGEEPFSRVTEIYNEAMSEIFSDRIQLHIIPRKQIEGEVISATRVREAYTKNNFSDIKRMVPSPTYNFLVEQAKNKE